MAEQPKCSVCGDPMPSGEEMFKFHGYSGPCPKPPLPSQHGRCRDKRHFWPDDSAEGDTCDCGQWYRFSDRIEATP